MAQQNKLTIKRVTNLRELNLARFKKILEEKWSPSRLKKFIKSPNSILLVARKRGIECGAIFAHFQQSHNSAQSTVFLQGVAVAPDFRRQGIATAMLENFKKVSKRMKSGKIIVVTNAKNQVALELYKKTGAEGPDSDKVVFEYSL